MGINQKITIGAVWPQLEKGASARPNVAGGSVGGGALSPPTLPPSRVPTGEGNFKAFSVSSLSEYVINVTHFRMSDFRISSNLLKNAT